MIFDVFEGQDWHKCDVGKVIEEKMKEFNIILEKYEENYENDLPLYIFMTEEMINAVEHFLNLKFAPHSKEDLRCHFSFYKGYPLYISRYLNFGEIEIR